MLDTRNTPYSKLKPADKKWLLVWLSFMAADAIFMAIYGGWLLIFGIIYILPQGLAMRLAVRVLIIDRWHKVSLITKLATSYIFAIFLIFTRAVTDSTYNSFILFGFTPEEGSGADVFLSRIEPVVWIIAAACSLVIICFYIASRRALRKKPNKF